MQGHLVAVRFPESGPECPRPARVRESLATIAREENSGRLHRVTREGRASRCRAREWEPREERVLLRLFPYVRAVAWVREFQNLISKHLVWRCPCLPTHPARRDPECMIGRLPFA